jgi:peptide/nickel transport system permease protein
MLRALGDNPKLAFGLTIVVIFILAAIFAPLITHSNDPDKQVAITVYSPSAQHILGTTNHGQDLFAQLVYGARVSLLLGFFAATGSTILQVIFGLTAGYFGGVIDETLSLIINIMLVLPSLPLAIVIAAIAKSPDAAGRYNGEFLVALILLFTSWAYGARVLRAQTLTIKQREYVAAAKATGESSFRIIFAEILPNEVALVASTFVGTFVYAVGAEVALDFIGLGDATKASWGTILYWAQSGDAMLGNQWWLFVPAGLCVAVLCAALTFINYGIDEIANPHLREKSPKRWKRQMKSQGTVEA